MTVNLKNSKVISSTVAAMCNLCDVKVTSEPVELEEEITMMSHGALKDFDTLSWEDLVSFCRSDESTLKIIRTIQKGFPENRQDCDDDIKQIWHFRHDLYQVEGVHSADTRVSAE